MAMQRGSDFGRWQDRLRESGRRCATWASTLAENLARDVRSREWRQQHFDLRRTASVCFVLAGVILLAYVGWSYGSMWMEQRALARQWEQQQQAALASQTAAAAGKSVAHVQPVDDGLTRLTIPKINLDAIVVQGSSEHALKLGPGHMKDTPAPGDAGNSVISGHRDTFFRHVHELEKGDQVLVERDGRTYRYEVTGKKILDPTDTWVTHPTKDSELTLITCYPTYYIGPAPHRLVVFSKLIGEQPESAASAAETAAAATAAH